ncbi:MAG: GAF domain-containing protein [Anaerolineales bacterium]
MSMDVPASPIAPLELLYQISRELAAALDLRTVLQRVLYAALQYVGGERGSIVVLDDSGKPVEATMVYGKQYHEHTTPRLRETVERGLAGWVIRHRKAALVPDTSRDERWLRRPDDSSTETGAKSAICVPLLAREKLVGVLTLVHPIPNTFTEQHLQLMQAIADQAGIAVLNARLYTESQRQARVMSALVECAIAINASLNLKDVFRRILQQTMQALQVETVALGLVEETGNMLVFRAADGLRAGALLDRRLPMEEGVIGWVMRQGKGVILPAGGGKDRPSVSGLFEDQDISSAAIVPIHGQEGIIGVLVALNPLGGAFDSDALLVMTGIGSLAGIAIQNALFAERIQMAQRRYRELFDESIDAILLTDLQGRILEANRQALQLFGYDPQEILSCSIDQLYHAPEGITLQSLDALDEDGTLRFESVVHTREGGQVPVEVYARRRMLEQHDVIQWMFHDIHERKELDALRDDLAAMIYHDLRSPLGNLISSLELLKSVISTDDHMVVSILEIASHAVARLQRMVNSLLDIHRLEAGVPLGERQPVRVGDLLQKAAGDIRMTLASRDQTLEIQNEADSAWVLADADMIARVLINLLENASKFSPSQSRILLGAQLPENAPQQVRFWVRDNGPGIAPADQERIFEKFTRLARKEGVRGLGIGLAFCRLAVQAHGGQIGVESEPGHGATFFFTLPRHLESA